MNGHACNVGSNIAFQRDHHKPTLAEGRTMLAQELSHVMPQRSGRVD
jgi:hypothetical protein